MRRRLSILPDWQAPPGLGAIELDATWARLTITVDEDFVTLVHADGSPRGYLNVSAYPLAEWIAFNWWPLRAEVRVSGYDAHHWSWRHAAAGSWHRRHNVRAAGNGMTWPDLTFIPEGAVTRLSWWPATASNTRLLADGTRTIATGQIDDELVRFVDSVIARLDERGVTGTPLHREWAAIAALDAEEKAFAEAVGRLGLDPFSITDDTADAILALDRFDDDGFVDDILDTVEPTNTGLRQIGTWLQHATELADSAVDRHSIDVTSARVRDLVEIDSRKPWIAGFQAAATVRDHMGFHAGRVDASLLAAAVTTPRRHRADLMDGYTQNVDGHSVVVIAGEGRSEELDRFLRARSLGLHLLRPDRTRFVMSDVRSPLQSAARSFAAELLAPAADVVAMRDEVGGPDASAFDIIARRFQVSTEVVERQYTNRVRT